MLASVGPAAPHAKGGSPESAPGLPPATRKPGRKEDESRLPASALRQAAQKRYSAHDHVLLVRCELGGDRLGEPAFSPGSVFGECSQAALRHAYQYLAPIDGIRGP